MTRVAIVGGGVAGLMATWELGRLGFDVDLFEASDELGGLAGAFDFDGLRIERFYHFICRNDRTLIGTCGRLELDDLLHWEQTRTGFFYDGELYPFGSSLDLLGFRPLSLLDKIRFGLNILYSRRLTRWHTIEDVPAKQWLLERIGKRAYSVIWDPLLRVKFDEYHEQVSAAWMWHRIHRVATSRRSMFHREEFGYLEGGSQTLIRAFEKEISASGVRIHLRTKVHSLWVEGERCRGLCLEDGRHAFDWVICAVPLPVYRRLLPPEPTAYRDRIDAIRFIGVVCVILRLRHPVSPNFWLNIHDPRISFNGIIEYSNLYSPPGLNGRSIVYVPFYLSTERPRYRFGDEQLLEECVEALRVVNPDFRKDWVEAYRVFRAPHAQPICTCNFSEIVPPFETPWNGCYLIESTQLYPADRVISGTLRLAQDVVLRILQREGMEVPPPLRRRDATEIPS